MQGLETILEEINEEIKTSIAFSSVFTDGLVRARNIIRKHMNDGWIPVEERLPEEEKEVLVTTDTGEITFGYISAGEWYKDLDPDYPIAWLPLPEPYRTERSEP